MTAATMSVPTPSKLPVWRTVGASYAIVWRNLGQLVRISWLWILIMIPAYAGLHWLTLRYRHDQLLPVIAQLPFLSSLAVAWHRLVLRQERVAVSAYFRLDRTVWAYTLWSAVLLAIGAVPLSLLFLLRGADVAERSTAELLWLTAGLFAYLAVAVIAVSRLSLVLPALAVGEKLSLTESFRRTRGNGLRFAIASVLCLLPWMLLLDLAATAAAFVLGFSWERMDEIARSYGYVVLTSLCHFVFAILGVTLLSLAYSFFAGPGDRRASPSA